MVTTLTDEERAKRVEVFAERFKRLVHECAGTDVALVDSILLAQMQLVASCSRTYIWNSKP